MVDDEARLYFQKAIWHFNQYQVWLNYAYWTWVASRTSPKFLSVNEPSHSPFMKPGQNSGMPISHEYVQDTLEQMQHNDRAHTGCISYDPQQSIGSRGKFSELTGECIKRNKSRKRHRQRKRQKVMLDARSNRFPISEDSELNSNDPNETDLSLELDEDFRKFLEISEKHRTERAKAKKDQEEGIGAANEDHQNSNQEAEIEYIDAGSKMIKGSTKAPSYRNKNKEYMELYGESKGKLILGLETTLQLDFDKYQDEKRPVFWPYIPLRL